MTLTEPQILKNYLSNTGVTQGELAERLGMSRQNLLYHLSKDKFTPAFKEKLKEIGIEWEPSPFVNTVNENKNQGYGRQMPLNKTQMDVLLTSNTASLYALTEMLSEVLSIVGNRPLPEVREQANRLTKWKVQALEKILEDILNLS